jgi:hypothetical protein
MDKVGILSKANSWLEWSSLTMETMDTLDELYREKEDSMAAIEDLKLAYSVYLKRWWVAFRKLSKSMKVEELNEYVVRQGVT